MRMTAATIYRDAGASIEQASEQMLEFQRQVASGRRISRASDDPQGTATAIGERAGIAAVEQYTRTSDSVTARLMVVDTALSDIIERLSQAQVAVVSVQGTPKPAAQREVAAQTLEGIRDAILADLNTSFRGAYLFAGAGSTEPPFAADANGVVGPYAGSTREVAVEIDQNRSVTIGLDGSAIAQGGAAADVFAVLDAASAAARTGDAAGLQQALTDLAAAFDRATFAQMRTGTSLAAIDAQKAQLGERRLAGAARVAAVEHVDLAQAITGLKQAETAYSAALGATGRITQLSLMDYLK
jgi:flagellar hook-associated protein 3 FlgL